MTRSNKTKAWSSFSKGLQYGEKVLKYIGQTGLASDIRSIKEATGPFGEVIKFAEGADNEISSLNRSIQHSDRTRMIRSKLTRGETSSITDVHPTTHHENQHSGAINRTISTADYAFQSYGAQHSRGPTSNQYISRSQATS